jgi:anti-sigma factor RsiW
MTCSEVRNEIDAYVLGVLEDDEARAVTAHLAACEDCRRLQQEAEHAAHLLPMALARVSPLKPPEDLKARLMETARISAPIRPPEPQLPDNASARPSNRLAPRLLPDERRGGRWWGASNSPVWQRIAAAIALAIVMASVAWSVRLSSALDSERATRERVEAFYSAQQELVLEVVDSSKTTRQILRPVDEESNAYGKLFVRSDLPDVVVMAARLPTPPEGQAYHLWLTSGGQLVDAGVFPIDDQGFGLLTIEADRPGPTYEAAELRLQPPGVEGPAGTVALRWDAASPES